MFHYWNRLTRSRYGDQIGPCTRWFVNTDIDPRHEQAIADAIARYRPKWGKVASDEFAVFADLVRGVVTTFGPSDVKQARRYMTALSQHALWCHRQRRMLEVETILDREVIEAFIARGMEGAARTTRRNARLCLLRLSRTVLSGSEAQPEAGTPAYAIANYRPWSTKPWAETFGEYGGFVREMIAEFGPASADEARHYMADLTWHVWWCIRRGHRLDRRVVLAPETIEDSVANMDDWTVGSQNARRCSLLRVSKRLLPQNAAARPTTFTTADEVIDYYRPNKTMQAGFDQNADFIRQTITDYEPDRVDLAQQMMSVLTRHVIWCREHHHPLDREVVLDPDVIETGVAQVWGGGTPLTQKTARNTLLRLSRALTKVGEPTAAPVGTPQRDVAQVIAEYTPRIDAADWSDIGGFVRAVVTDYEPTNPDIAGRTLFAATRHVLWCAQHGHPLEVEKVFRPQLIEVSVSQCMANLTPKSRAAYRARLYRVSEMLMTGPYQPVVRHPHTRKGAQQEPYTEAEVVLLRSWAANQRTDYRRNGAWVLLGLGLGAGLAAGEMTGVRAGDVTIDSQGVIVRVTQGSSPRSVPVLAEWEAPVVEAVRAARDTEQFLFLPRRETSSVYRGVTKFIRGTRFGRFPITLARLRTTWIVHHLTIGTPLRLLVEAAGFHKPENLGAYIPHLPGVDPEHARRLLRAAEPNGVVDDV